MYRILSVGSDFHEICDECGFQGDTLDLSATIAQIRTLPDRWSQVMSQDEEQLRARPEPDTWCAVEYAQHVLNAIEGIEWAARTRAPSPRHPPRPPASSSAADEQAIPCHADVQRSSAGDNS